MGLARLGPTKLCKHGGPEFMFLGLFLNGFQWPLLLTWFNFNPSMDK